MKKVMILMTLFMGFTMSFVLSWVGTLSSGHFDQIGMKGWSISFGISFVISLVIGFIVPVKKIGDAACNKANIKPESMKGNLLSGLISNLIYTPVITIVMVVVMVGNAAKHAPKGHAPSIAQALPISLIISLVIGYIVIIITQPIFIKLLTKNMRPPVERQ